jgi:hypothetical protein
MHVPKLIYYEIDSSFKSVSTCLNKGSENNSDFFLPPSLSPFAYL